MRCGPCDHGILRGIRIGYTRRRAFGAYAFERACVRSECVHVLMCSQHSESNVMLQHAIGHADGQLQLAAHSQMGKAEGDQHYASDVQVIPA